eukprot:CAMPEP_0167767436 /NCGR_PEP_ID=MMETSP0110_2-20121227/16052_1 /TAXON_ID=629695 /ORGANISM="Gymnochlora sp., Strain CCMP2014" /LENGTH=380 /DNA_ID=CAMNT_0007655881 /DNA_START=917 /DNA_END=2059 /DNA_ORIENTATION=+
MPLRPRLLPKRLSIVSRRHHAIYNEDDRTDSSFISAFDPAYEPVREKPKPRVLPLEPEPRPEEEEEKENAPKPEIDTEPEKEPDNEPEPNIETEPEAEPEPEPEPASEPNEVEVETEREGAPPKPAPNKEPETEKDPEGEEEEMPELIPATETESDDGAKIRKLPKAPRITEPAPERNDKNINPKEEDDPELYDKENIQQRLKNQKKPYNKLVKATQDSNLTKVMEELESIMEGDPRNITILGTRHCNLLQQRIIELVSYALILTGNRITTSGGMGTNYVAIRGALRARRNTTNWLSVILPQTISDQPLEVQQVLKNVSHITELGHSEMELDVASRLCNSACINDCQELIIFAYHDSWTVLDAAAEARRKDKLVTLMYLD